MDSFWSAFVWYFFGGFTFLILSTFLKSTFYHARLILYCNSLIKTIIWLEDKLDISEKERSEIQSELVHKIETSVPILFKYKVYNFNNWKDMIKFYKKQGEHNDD